MEKVLSNDDKVRRAEEIYYRRKRGIPSSRFSKIEGEKKSYLGSKILLQILVIINLSIIIIAIQNKEYIFTENFLKDIQSYNINLTQSLRQLIGFDVEDVESEITTENVNIEPPSEVEVQENTDPLVTEGIVPNDEGQSSSLNEMDEEISKIKELVAIQKPINEGTITSRFGARQSSYKNVEGYHTGIDIGAVKRNIYLCGDIRKSKFSIKRTGIIGKHLKIENNGVETLYAHCSKILVGENDVVEIGQEIAKVGSTGNSTGPHLHFEIRYLGKYVDPSKILEF